MARGVNKVILIGHLGADPESRAMPSGSSVANLRIATTESWRDKQSGEQQERTCCSGTASPSSAGWLEIAGEYLKKGSQVYIEGRLRTRKWQDKQGNDRYSTEIVGNEMLMLGGRGGGGGWRLWSVARGGGGGGGRGPRDAACPSIHAPTGWRRWWWRRRRWRRRWRAGRLRRRYPVLVLAIG